MTAYDALLLDHDGVIVNVADGDAVRSAAITAFRDAGVDDPTDEQVDTLAFGPTRPELDALSDQVGVESATLWRHRDDNLADALQAAARDGHKEPYPGVDALAGLDYPVGIASNNQRRVVEYILDHHAIAGEFDALRAREPHVDSLDRKKPAPTFLREATADLGVSNPLYVGDKESDLIAGHHAGFDTALVRREHNQGVTPDHEPTYEVDGLDSVVDILQSA
jgi:HAD superfamily hydrolase (TIGR01549 family)